MCSAVPCAAALYVSHSSSQPAQHLLLQNIAVATVTTAAVAQRTITAAHAAAAAWRECTPSLCLLLLLSLLL
jgi:hypothetical protein